ncbi:MAG: hypothetical protein DWQ37_17300 [Planctomycetota bacterium]|nr:MAG: hypothetical protein DWQ37_17300 [Planctomycetota bacterium]
MSTRWILAAAVTAALVAAGAGARGGEDDEAGSFWMQKKLEYSENILEALAREDYPAISKNARSMNALSQMEKWVRGSGEYRAQLKIFQNANKQLIRMGDEENLDGASLAYVQLTLSCVNCHKVVRDRSSETTLRAR